MSRPGSQFSHGAKPRNISSDSRVRNRISPIQVNSGNAASDHDALPPHTVVASTLPAGMELPANCMPAHPVAISATAIQTPAPSSSVRKPSRIAAMESNSMSDPALHGALDDLFGGQSFRQFVARRENAADMDQLVDKGDEEDDEAAAVAELRNPQGYRDHALRDVVKLPRLPRHDHGIPGEEADEADADEERDDFDIVPRLVAEAVDQQSDADHLAVPEGVREPEKGSRCHAPGDEIVARRDVDAQRPAGRQHHHQHENRNEEEPREIAGKQVKPIEKHADHDFFLARILPGSNRRAASGGDRLSGEAEPEKGAGLWIRSGHLVAGGVGSAICLAIGQ